MSYRKNSKRQARSKQHRDNFITSTGEYENTLLSTTSWDEFTRLLALGEDGFYGKVKCWIHLGQGGNTLKKRMLPSKKNILAKTGGRRKCHPLQSIDYSRNTLGKVARVSVGKTYVSQPLAKVYKTWSRK